jgi:hypothetical protein
LICRVGSFRRFEGFKRFKVQGSKFKVPGFKVKVRGSGLGVPPVLLYLGSTVCS